MNDYQRIEKAIAFLKQNFKTQPDLDTVAEHVHLSPFHFQRLFTDWAGVSPKKFIQFLSLEYAKELLKKNLSLEHVSFESGLSATSRLHDLFINIEGMAPGEFKKAGEGLHISYSFQDTLFGPIIIASTNKGICFIAFINSDNEGFVNLKHSFPRAIFEQKQDENQTLALRFFNKDWTDLQQIKLHLKGTPFQIKVWQSLLHIPVGHVSTYGSVATNIDNASASRAVGTAIGSNPIAFIIPCHRVIKSSGLIGEYHWGSARKNAILAWEAVIINN